MSNFHIAFRDLLHAVNLRHGTDGFTSPPKEGGLRIFLPWKIRRLRPGLNPRTWVPKAKSFTYCLQISKQTCIIPHASTIIFKIKYNMKSVPCLSDLNIQDWNTVNDTNIKNYGLGINTPHGNHVLLYVIICCVVFEKCYYSHSAMSSITAVFDVCKTFHTQFIMFWKLYYS
jgi:hypothetical protein